MRTKPTVNIRLDGNGRIYRPGELLSGEYVFLDIDASLVKSIEASVLWFTEGKGEEDMAVHEFWRTNVEENSVVSALGPHHFASTLPHSPLTYDGWIVKIRWCVRVRAFLHRGKEIFGQKIFQLGDVPPLPTPGGDTE